MELFIREIQSKADRYFLQENDFMSMMSSAFIGLGTVFQHFLDQKIHINMAKSLRDDDPFALGVKTIRERIRLCDLNPSDQLC